MASLKRNRSASSGKKSERNQPIKDPPSDIQPSASQQPPRPPARLPHDSRNRKGYEQLLPSKHKTKKAKEKTKGGKTAWSSRQVACWKCGKQLGEDLLKADSSLCPECQEAFSDSDENYEKLDPSEIEIKDKMPEEPPNGWPDTTVLKAEHLHHLLIKGNLGHVRPYLMTLPGKEQQAVVSEIIGGNTALYLALKRKALLLMAFLLETCGADANQLCFIPNAADEMVRSSCLIKAASTGYLDAVELLVTNGAEVDLTDEAGWTALSSACYEGQSDVVKYLIRNGASVHVVTCRGATCIMLALHSPDIVQFLISSGSDVNATDVLDRSALHYAAEWGRVEAATLLLKHGADVNVPDQVGNTPLHDAVATGSLQMVKLLIDHGADPYIRNRDKEDAMLMAFLENETEKLRYLASVHRRKKSEGNS